MALYFLELFVGLTILVRQILVTPEILFYPLLTDISDVPYCIYTITKDQQLQSSRRRHFYSRGKLQCFRRCFLQAYFCIILYSITYMFLGPIIATLFGPNLIGPQKYFLKIKMCKSFDTHFVVPCLPLTRTFRFPEKVHLTTDEF